MSWWVYKCNSRNLSHQGDFGDWDDFFENPEQHWGSIENVPAMKQLQVGDKILAYQTDRNELVGLARVTRSSEGDGCVYLTPERLIRVRVRPLKQADPRIAVIPALQGGLVMTIYKISAQGAHDCSSRRQEAGLRIENEKEM